VTEGKEWAVWLLTIISTPYVVCSAVVIDYRLREWWANRPRLPRARVIKGGLTPSKECLLYGHEEDHT
jgi:hypothetical protein